jgi:hypothetical protein
MSAPMNNSDTVNQARTDALSDRKADTRLWPDEARRTYEVMHNSTKKSS